MMDPMEDNNDDLDFDLPPVRSEREVLEEMRTIAATCIAAEDDADAARLFDRALSTMLELRVPRMPDDPAELEAMIVDGRKGPFYTTEEVMEHLKEHGRAFSGFLNRYRADVAAGVWNSAATSLLPKSSDAGIEWHDGRYLLSVSLSSEGAGGARIRHDGPDGTEEVSAASRIGGLAMLASIMLAHDRWHGAWRR
jgi:hypothetical protein